MQTKPDMTCAAVPPQITPTCDPWRACSATRSGTPCGRPLWPCADARVAGRLATDAVALTDGEEHLCLTTGLEDVAFESKADRLHHLGELRGRCAILAAVAAPVEVTQWLAPDTTTRWGRQLSPGLCMRRGLQPDLLAVRRAESRDLTGGEAHTSPTLPAESAAIESPRSDLTAAQPGLRKQAGRSPTRR